MWPKLIGAQFSVCTFRCQNATFVVQAPLLLNQELRSAHPELIERHVCNRIFERARVVSGYKDFALSQSLTSEEVGCVEVRVQNGELAVIPFPGHIVVLAEVCGLAVFASIVQVGGHGQRVRIGGKLQQLVHDDTDHGVESAVW